MEKKVINKKGIKMLIEKRKKKKKKKILQEKKKYFKYKIYYNSLKLRFYQ